MMLVIIEVRVILLKLQQVMMAMTLIVFILNQNLQKNLNNFDIVKLYTCKKDLLKPFFFLHLLLIGVFVKT